MVPPHSWQQRMRRSRIDEHASGTTVSRFLRAENSRVTKIRIRQMFSTNLCDQNHHRHQVAPSSRGWAVMIRVNIPNDLQENLLLHVSALIGTWKNILKIDRICSSSSYFPPPVDLPISACRCCYIRSYDSPIMIHRSYDSPITHVNKVCHFFLYCWKYWIQMYSVWIHQSINKKYTT